MKYIFALALLSSPLLHSHCQMPCGIYHDDMVFDQIDQYVETMVKCTTVLNGNKFESLQDRNELVRWIMSKENMSNEIANFILTYFLQQKIKPDEPDTVKRLVAAHKLLCDLVLIKQTADPKYVQNFSDEWEKFKLMFHVEGYECKMEKVKLTAWGEKKSAAEKEHDHLHETGTPHTHD